jgi:hypothetical protein
MVAGRSRSRRSVTEAVGRQSVVPIPSLQRLFDRS